MKLSDRTQIADADISLALLAHVAELGTPNLSYKTTLSKIIPYLGANVLFVSKSGNDTIAAAAPYMPFLTITAAITHGATLTPSSTSPVDIYILGGNWTEAVTLSNYINIHFLGARYNAQITDNSVAVNCVITSNNTLGNSSGNCLVALAASTITVLVNNLIGRVYLGNSSANVYVKPVVWTVNDDNHVNHGNGTFTCDGGRIIATGSQSNLLINGSAAGFCTFKNCVIISDQENVTTQTGSTTTSVRFFNCRVKTAGSNKDNIKSTVNSGSNISVLIHNSSFYSNGSGVFITSSTLSLTLTCEGSNDANDTVSSLVAIQGNSLNINSNITIE